MMNFCMEQARRDTGTTRVEAGVSFVADTFPAANHPCVAAGQWATGILQYGIGHGTSVASVLGGRRYGVAKEVILTPVRVFGCNGGANSTRFLDGLDWIRVHYASNGIPAVVNVSGYVLRLDPGVANTDRDAIEASVNQTIAAGLVFVASANNQNGDACWTSPAHIPGVITVAGSALGTSFGSVWDTTWVSPDPVYNEDTNVDPGTSWGVCVDIFAPAHNIRSAHVTSATAFRTQNHSGTSFAAPHVAGSVARWLQGRSKSTTNPASAWSFLNAYAGLDNLVDTVDNPLNGSPNKLIHMATTD